MSPEMFLVSTNTSPLYISTLNPPEIITSSKSVKSMSNVTSLEETITPDTTALGIPFERVE